MPIKFNDVFHPTDEQKRKHAEYVNSILCESLKNNGECCCNCKYNTPSYAGLGVVLPRCMKKKKFIEKDERCVYYEFCGFIEMP
jgi:hypothetical protein